MRIAITNICVVIISNILSNIDIAALSVAVYDDPKCAAVSVDADKGDYSYDDDDNGNDINKYKRQYCY